MVKGRSSSSVLENLLGHLCLQHFLTWDLWVGGEGPGRVGLLHQLVGGTDQDTAAWLDWDKDLSAGPHYMEGTLADLCWSGGARIDQEGPQNGKYTGWAGSSNPGSGPVGDLHQSTAEVGGHPWGVGNKDAVHLSGMVACLEAEVSFGYIGHPVVGWAPGLGTG